MIPSQLEPLTNHVWKSTLFAAVAGLLTLALRNNRAQTRYCLWLAASGKFLVPFSLLVMAGSHFGRQSVKAPVSSGLTLIAEEAARPFEVTLPVVATPAVRPSFVNLIPPILGTVWAIGFVILLFSWWSRWRQIHAALGAASPIDLPIGVKPIGVKVMSSPEFFEPGVFGICHPVLILPAGITSHLTPAQLEAVLMHELCHVRRRDNLATVIHMVVESVFWFHPLVWWLGARLMEERERACDEEVLKMGSAPETYTEGILKICELYVESPLQCVAGVTGANLKKRIEAIMRNRIAQKLNGVQKALLASTGALALAAPLAIGLISAQAIRAQGLAIGQILHATGDRPSFEVATIKPWKRPPNPPPPPDGATAPVKVMKVSPGAAVGLRMILPISILITSAYNLPVGSERRMIGGPDWLRQDIDQFEIQAKIEDSEYAAMQKMTPAQQHERVALMEQSLLADRFRLKVHFETREMPVYALEVAKGGAKLNPAKPEESSRISTLGNEQGNEMTAVAVTLDQFVLSPLLTGAAGGRPVVDRTGLKGAFDFTLKYTPDQLKASTAAKEAGGDEPSFFNAIREQLGLVLVLSKAPAEVIVIDHIEQPSAN